MWSRRRSSALLLIGALLFLLIGGRLAAELVVELLWYRSLDLERVFWLRWGAGAAVRAVLALAVGAFVFANLWVVSRSLGSIRVRRRYANIEIAEQLPQSYVIAALALISLFSAWWLSGGLSDPLAVLAAFDPVRWGVADPVFGRDLSFYVFTLPLLESAQTLSGVLLFWTALLALAAYVATGAVRMEGGRPHFSPLARRHLGFLVAGFLLVYAADAWLDRYALLVQGSGVGGAFGYADFHARLPGRTALSLLALLAAAAAAYGSWRSAGRLTLAAVSLLFLALIGTRLIYPTLVQKVVVEPNEFPRERPFIERHLAFTRLAFGLRDLERVALPYAPAGELQPDSVLRVLAGIPLWDARPLLTAFAQRQSLFPYYDFVSVHPDRYGQGEDAEQVAVAVRELEPGRLPVSAQTWQNLHLTYVSGEGAVVSPVSRMAADGAPIYYLSDLDPPRLSARAPEGVRLEEPSVYFGERTAGYVILPPASEPRGVRLDAAWKRLVFAWAFQSKNLFLSAEVRDDSRIVYRRQIVERARAAAPFLHFLPEGGALPVLVDGHVVWMLDGYTASSAFPLSTRVPFGAGATRYLRNSAKVTVDALTGEVRLYEVEADPILRSYARLLPGLVRPAAEMPAALRSHLRFPAALMALQADVLGEYHLADARAFYEKEDVWSVATENYRSESQLVEPVYAMLPLPGDAEAQREFLLMVPFVAQSHQNMTALLVTRNDPPHYGEQRLYLLPRDEQVPGPQQVEAMIDQDPEISQQLSLWRQGGSDVLRGHLVVVPIDGTLLYVEPLYLEAENAAIPQLERVIVATGGRVVMRPTLAGAVAALTGSEPESPEATRRAGAAAAQPAQQPAAEPSREPDERLSRARQLLDQADRQLRTGDLAAFGRTWAELRELLSARRQ